MLYWTTYPPPARHCRHGLLDLQHVLPACSFPDTPSLPHIHLPGTAITVYLTAPLPLPPAANPPVRTYHHYLLDCLPGLFPSARRCSHALLGSLPAPYPPAEHCPHRHFPCPIPACQASLRKNVPNGSGLLICFSKISVVNKLILIPRTLSPQKSFPQTCFPKQTPTFIN